MQSYKNGSGWGRWWWGEGMQARKPVYLAPGGSLTLFESHA